MKSHRNIQKVLERKSFPLFLQALNNHVDTKEWSEVGGVFEVCRKLLGNFSPGHVFDVGCGRRPTLALLMALNYPFQVHAVDPNLDLSLCYGVERIHLYNLKLAEFARFGVPETAMALVLANHSHAPLKEIRTLLGLCKSWVYITVPCCVDNRLRDMAGVHLKDPHMHSEKNDVYVYSNEKGLLSTLL